MILLVHCLAALVSLCGADVLSPDQKAPLFASGAGGLSLQAPLLSGPNDRGGKAPIAILKQSNRPNTGDGEYSFSFETADDVQREEVGKLKKVGDQLVNTVEGQYSYKSPEGLPIIVKYAADENGARASFTFGTDPGRRPQSLTELPGLPQSGNRDSKSQKLGNAYLPPQPPAKVTNGYLPPQ